MTRLHFKDGTYIDVTNDQLHFWLMDPELDEIEGLYSIENGKIFSISEE